MIVTTFVNLLFKILIIKVINKISNFTASNVFQALPA